MTSCKCGHPERGICALKNGDPMYKLVIVGIDGKEPLSCPVEFEFKTLEEAQKHLDSSLEIGLTAFIVND